MSQPIQQQSKSPVASRVGQRVEQPRRSSATTSSALVALACLLALISGPLLTTLGAGGAPTPVALASDAANASTASSTAPLLPGESLWNGVPSDMLGVGDTWDYAGAGGFDHSATIQAQVKAAHVPLIRAFFETVNETDHTSLVPDSTQLTIARAIQGSGAQCMANLMQPVTVAQALHLVSLLAPYCRYFEVMNEPDLSGSWPPAVSVANYLAFWTAFVPQARALDPSAAFGGPALADEFGLDNGSYMQDVLSGMAQSGVWPDFVTFHWYICAGDAQSNCLNDAATSTPGHGKTVASWIAQDFPGRAVALGITEWSADPGNPSWAYDDAFMAQFEQTALSGFERNPYLAFATQFDLGSYAGYGTLDLFRTVSGEPFTNTPSALGAARPSFGVLAAQIAALRGASGSGSGNPPPTPTPSPTHAPPAPTPTATHPPSPTPTPKPSPSPTATPKPTPKPTEPPTSTPSPKPTEPPPPPAKGVPCIEVISGVMTVGTCVGTFTPKA